MFAATAGRGPVPTLKSVMPTLIHRDRPEAVVAAIRDVVTAVRGGGTVRYEGGRG
jgi:hypothetical protein